MSELPATLPEKPVGWTKRLDMHLNFGSGKGLASYTIFDASGAEMPIGYMYDTTPPGQRGYFLIGREKNSPPMSWSQLCQCWPRFLEKRNERDHQNTSDAVRSRPS